MPHRVIENKTVSDWNTAGQPESQRPGEGEVVTETGDGKPVRRYEDSLAIPGMEGAVEELPLYAGQSTGLTHEIQPVDELVATLTKETIKALESVNL